MFICVVGGLGLRRVFGIECYGHRVGEVREIINVEAIRNRYLGKHRPRPA